VNPRTHAATFLLGGYGALARRPTPSPRAASPPAPHRVIRSRRRLLHLCAGFNGNPFAAEWRLAVQEWRAGRVEQPRSGAFAKLFSVASAAEQSGGLRRLRRRQLALAAGLRSAAFR
jgi:hypothetical protein